MKWVVKRIDHLHQLLQTAQSKLGATLRTGKPRLIFPKPIGNLKYGSLKQ